MPSVLPASGLLLRSPMSSAQKHPFSSPYPWGLEHALSALRRLVKTQMAAAPSPLLILEG